MPLHMNILPKSYLSKIFALILLVFVFIEIADSELTKENSKLAWIVGKWRSEFSGKVFWPTVPTMTYGEELIIAEAPKAKTTTAQFLNFTARAWSHSTKDHFHDEVYNLRSGRSQIQQVDANFEGYWKNILFQDLPVEDLRRTFIKHDDTYMEQILEMRTATHPKLGYLEHTRVIYSRQDV
uniref:THAP4-like heme-binding beta-barrel domain-containing protein n=1 Tax=Ditylenchus dipsaci TaxID=166011 RepID=A0A915CVK1_9BILA